MPADFLPAKEPGHGPLGAHRSHATQRVRIVFLVLVAMILLSGMAYAAWHVSANYHRALRTTHDNLLILSRALQNEFRAMLGDGLGAASSSYMHISAHPEIAPDLDEALLREDLRGGNYVRGIFFAVQGRFVAAFRDHGPLRLAEAPPWARCAGDKVTCALPVVEFNGSEYLPIVKRMTTPGQREYTIGALYGIDELASLYQRLSLPHATYTLTTTDGLILSRIDTAGKRSVEPTSITRLAAFPRLAAVTAKEPVILEGFSTLTAEFNVASVIRIADDVPLLISVAIPRTQVLAPWKNSTRNIVAATAGATLLLLLGTALLYRFFVMLSQREIQLLRAQRELQQLNETLESRVRERTAELEEANARLAAANAELEEFTASASHDLRSPLGTISKQCAMIENSLQTESRAAEITQRFEKVQSGVRRASEVIDGLLSLARISRQDLQKVPVSLSSVASQVIDELREAEPARNYEFTCAEGVCVEADPRLMKSLLSNLLGNSWKYSTGRDPARIEFGIDSSQPEAVFFVRDNGAGFNMAYSKNMFQAFKRLHSADRFAGTGIGLATAARIVKRYGGRISAEAVEHEGATFYFTLPLAIPTARRLRAAPGRETGKNFPSD